jgi:hypothetical protein
MNINFLLPYINKITYFELQNICKYLKLNYGNKNKDELAVLFIQYLIKSHKVDLGFDVDIIDFYDMKIKREYSRFNFVYNVLERELKSKIFFHPLTKQNTKDYIARELGNILERFILNISNSNKKKYDEIFYKLNDNNEFLEKALSETREKNITFFNDPNKTFFKEFLVDQINTFISQKLEDNIIGDNQDNIIVKGTTFIYKDFSYKLKSKRLKCFYERLELNKILDKDIQNKIILIMLLRYKSMFPVGNQWGFSEEMYKNLHDNFGVILEGFASPINSQLLLINPHTKFCSLFIDTDWYFGSMGSVFDLDFDEVFESRSDSSLDSDSLRSDSSLDSDSLRSDSSKDSLFFNPPYVIFLMDKVMDKILDYISHTDRKLHIIFNGPNWTDADYFINAKKSKYLVYSEKMEKDKHYYVNTNNTINDESERIQAKFESQMFVFSNLKDEIFDYKNLTKGYKV